MKMVSIARLIKEMPVGYDKACFTEKAIQRKRGIDNPDNLMMLSMFHLLNGCSLTEISVIAELTKLGKISDVAFMKRFENCNNWFMWITSNIITNGSVRYEKPQWLGKYDVYGVDASDVREKGRSGRLYRLHYMLELFKMKSEQYKITTNKVGETLCNFDVKANDLILGDRGYVSLNGVEHCINNEGSFIFRYRKNSFKLYDDNGEAINLLERLKTHEDTPLDLRAYAKGSKGEKIALRVCAKRKTPEAIINTSKKLRRREHKNQAVMGEDTKKFNEYIVLITNLTDNILPEDILELYRFRWQIEIYFKRLKSIMDFGELPKRREKSVFAWLNGKLMIALLIETIIGKADFSPSRECAEKCVERN
jgi:hypothetical protein